MSFLSIPLHPEVVTFNISISIIFFLFLFYFFIPKDWYLTLKWIMRCRKNWNFRPIIRFPKLTFAWENVTRDRYSWKFLKGTVCVISRDLLFRALPLLFQNFKPVCQNIGSLWRNRRNTVEKITKWNVWEFVQTI